MLRFLSIYPFHVYERGISHIFSSLCLPHFDDSIQIKGIAPSIAHECRRSNLTPALPRYSKWLAYRLRISRQITEWQFGRQLQKFDAAYIWPAISSYAPRQARRQNKPIFLERINCFAGSAKRILDEAYARLKVPPTHPVTSKVVQAEVADAERADFIFCPSPWVKESYLEAGVPDEKLLLSSYGWSTRRFPELIDPSFHRPQSPSQSSSRPFTIVFVGSVCVRKGAHLLLEAYARSGVKGRLVLCGYIEPVIQEVCRDLLQRPDVIHHSFTQDVSAFYKDADVFAFPTLEEGSPLVSYEAMAHGLPMLVSPMGAGAVVRDRIEGYVLPPYEIDAWADAIHELAVNPHLLQNFSQAARQRAMDFTFDQVARRRARMMRQCMGAGVLQAY
jgi:glycosyltransferase involved in cell wall biosynthesis